MVFTVRTKAEEFFDMAEAKYGKLTGGFKLVLRTITKEKEDAMPKNAAESKIHQRREC